MVFFNYATMQMAAKIVYYGPGLCGKTTNLHHIYSKTSPQSRGEMVSLETETDRTLFFDLLPIDVGVIGGFKTRLQLYTVPGQVFYNTTRKLVLKGVDGIVFVSDSQRRALDGNVESFKNLRENLAEIGLDIDELPLVIQLNKRDLPNAVPTAEMLDALDPERKFEHVESVASVGTGVFETLKTISKLTLRTLRRRMTGEDTRLAQPLARGGSLRLRAEEVVARTATARTMPATVRPRPADLPPVMPANVPASTAKATDLPAAQVQFDTESTVAAAVLDRSLVENPRESESIATESSTSPSNEPPAATAGEIAGDEGAALESPADMETSEESMSEGSISEEVAEDREIALTAEEPLLEDLEAKPAMKTVKVRSSVDIMAELESLRKRATQQPSPKPPKRDILADLANLRPRRDLHRSFEINIPAEVLPRTRAVRVTLEFEDGDQGIIETREQQVELGDTTDVQSLSVNLKVDLT